MKVKITEDVKDEFNARAFNYLEKIEKRLKEIENKIKLLYSQKKQIEEVLKPLKEEYEKILRVNSGDSEYKELLLEPAKIENRIKELEQGVYSLYNGIINKDNEKKHNLLRRPLEEDLQIAKEKVKQYELHEQDVREKYFKTKEELRYCKREIKSYEKDYYRKCRDERKIKLQIKKVETSAEKEKSIDERYLVLENTNESPQN